MKAIILNMNASLENIKRWGVRGSLGIIDQGVFSGANLILFIFLARWLNNEDFGAFAIGFAVLSIFIQVYTSFALEPMGILGPYNYQDRINAYLLGHIRLLFLLSIPTGIILGFVFWLNQYIYSYSATTSVLFFSSLSLPFILFPLLMRRVFYLLQEPGWALVGSIIYFLVSILMLLLIINLNILNGVSSVLIFSLSSFVSGLLMLLILRDKGPVSNHIKTSTIFDEVWKFGKWLILSGVLIGLATQSQIYLTGVLSSIEDAGAVRILQIFIQPMMLTSTALSALATPRITSEFAIGAYKAMRDKMIQYTIAFGGIALAYECLLVFWGSSLYEILFGSKYQILASQIPLWGLAPIFLSFSWGAAISLQASQKPQAVLIIAGSWAIFSLVPALLIIPVWGIWGATISIVTGFIAAFISTWILYWLLIHRVYMVEKRL